MTVHSALPSFTGASIAINAVALPAALKHLDDIFACDTR